MDEAFVYQWTNITNGKIYVGKHKGTIDDGYISSGKHFLQAYNLAPEQFKREIVFYGSDKECYEYESFLINRYINEYGFEKLYNLTTWIQLKQWKITCTYCGHICDPQNEQWMEIFKKYHFDNCDKKSKNISDITKTFTKKKYIEDLTLQELVIECKRVNKFLKENTINKKLLKYKSKLMKQIAILRKIEKT